MVRNHLISRLHHHPQNYSTHLFCWFFCFSCWVVFVFLCGAIDGISKFFIGEKFSKGSGSKDHQISATFGEIASRHCPAGRGNARSFTRGAGQSRILPDGHQCGMNKSLEHNHHARRIIISFLNVFIERKKCDNGQSQEAKELGTVSRPWRRGYSVPNLNANASANTIQRPSGEELMNLRLRKVRHDGDDEVRALSCVFFFPPFFHRRIRRLLAVVRDQIREEKKITWGKAKKKKNNNFKTTVLLHGGFLIIVHLVVVVLPAVGDGLPRMVGQRRCPIGNGRLRETDAAGWTAFDHHPQPRPHSQMAKCLDGPRHSQPPPSMGFCLYYSFPFKAQQHSLSLFYILLTF